MVVIDPTHPYFIEQRSKPLTLTLASFRRDLLQALFTKQHTRKKETHTNRDHDHHRDTESIMFQGGLDGAKKNISFSVKARFLTHPPMCVFGHKHVYVCVYTRVGERKHECNWI